MDQLLAKTKIRVFDVMKFYFQWILLLIVHGVVFFYFPIHGNNLNLGQGYC